MHLVTESKHQSLQEVLFVRPTPKVNSESTNLLLQFMTVMTISDCIWVRHTPGCCADVGLSFFFFFLPLEVTAWMIEVATGTVKLLSGTRSSSNVTQRSYRETSMCVNIRVENFLTPDIFKPRKQKQNRKLLPISSAENTQRCTIPELDTHLQHLLSLGCSTSHLRQNK